MQDEILDFQPAAPHAFDDVLRCADRAGDDVHLDLQAQAAHADRLTDILLAVDNELLGQHVQHLLVGRDVDRLGGFDDARNVGGGDLLVLDRDHAAGVEAADMASGDARVNIADLAVGHQFGFLKRALNRVHRGFDIDDHAFAHAAGFVLAQA